MTKKFSDYLTEETNYIVPKGFTFENAQPVPSVKDKNGNSQSIDKNKFKSNPNKELSRVCKLLLTNKNCEYCYDCTNCKDCEDCRDCVRCVECEDCGDCSDSKYCKECEGCVKCEQCYACNDCKECKQCEKCRNCKSCENIVGEKNKTGVVKKNINPFDEFKDLFDDDFYKNVIKRKR